MLEALAQAILRNAGVADESEEPNKGFSIKIGRSKEIQAEVSHFDDDEPEELRG